MQNRGNVWLWWQIYFSWTRWCLLGWPSTSEHIQFWYDWHQFWTGIVSFGSIPYSFSPSRCNCKYVTIRFSAIIWAKLVKISACMREVVKETLNSHLNTPESFRFLAYAHKWTWTGLISVLLLCILIFWLCNLVSKIWQQSFYAI